MEERGRGGERKKDPRGRGERKGRREKEGAEREGGEGGRDTYSGSSA